MKISRLCIVWGIATDSKLSLTTAWVQILTKAFEKIVSDLGLSRVFLLGPRVSSPTHKYLIIIIIIIIIILSFDNAPFPYKHAQRRITFHCQRIAVDIHIVN